MAEMLLPNSLSVIIPTYNRSEVIAKALEGYRAQSSPALIQELLVVDDGSTDDTESVVRQFSATAPFQVRYLRQPNQGPAAARNLGIRQARSNLLLFTDSDIIPERELVAQHIEWHKRNPEIGTAVLGYVTWSPAVEPTPFMRWYGEGSGRLFGYDQLQAGEKVSFRYFWTCNLSLKRDFLLTCGQFDEDFKGAAFEDVDLGYRLSKHGLQIFYNPAAIGYHYQFFSFEAACRKERGKDPAARVFSQKESGRLITGETEGKKDRTKYAAARSAAKKVAVALTRVLAPVRPWLDSKVPLPSFVYKLFLWYDLNHGCMVVDRKGHSSNRA